MKKLSVSVNIPAIGVRHDFLIPSSMVVKDVIELMLKILVSEYSLSDNISDLTLIGKDDSRILKSEYNFSQLGIADGAKLIMI